MTEEPGPMQSMGSQGVASESVTEQQLALSIVPLRFIHAIAFMSILFFFMTK